MTDFTSPNLLIPGLQCPGDKSSRIPYSWGILTGASSTSFRRWVHWFRERLAWAQPPEASNSKGGPRAPMAFTFILSPILTEVVDQESILVATYLCLFLVSGVHASSTSFGSVYATTSDIYTHSFFCWTHIYFVQEVFLHFLFFLHLVGLCKYHLIGNWRTVIKSPTQWFGYLLSMNA